jgi:hypothetical protein
MRSHANRTLTQGDCNNSAGCGYSFRASTNSYGPGFNTAGGGYYVAERTSNYIKVWFWSRKDASVPAAVKSGASNVDTSTFGTPAAYFPSSNTCNLDGHFGAHNIIINLTFCT